MKKHRYFLYIVSSKSRVLYTGMAHDLVERAWQHKSGEQEGFTKKYRVPRLVYFEVFRYVKNCINREKQVKAWTRAKRVALIESMNPTWEDLAEDWFLPGGELNLKSRSLASLGMTNWKVEEPGTEGAIEAAPFQRSKSAKDASAGAAPVQRLSATGGRA